MKSPETKPQKREATAQKRETKPADKEKVLENSVRGSDNSLESNEKHKLSRYIPTKIEIEHILKLKTETKGLNLKKNTRPKETKIFF